MILFQKVNVIYNFSFFRLVRLILYRTASGEWDLSVANQKLTTKFNH